MQHSGNTSITRRGARDNVLGFCIFGAQPFPTGRGERYLSLGGFFRRENDRCGDLGTGLLQEILEVHLQIVILSRPALTRPPRKFKKILDESTGALTRLQRNIWLRK